MQAQELAEKFKAKVAAAAAERDLQRAYAADRTAERMDDISHCKRAMTENVIPFLT